MNDLEIYNKVREVPEEAKKEIRGGRLNGKTDINPMWRIKILTEIFGVCGFGWRYEITKQWLEHGENGEVSAFCNILLYVKQGDEWSQGIPGTGGSAFVAKERNGLYTSDECYKMALTDAISVACKALGVAADVYWNSDNTKYTKGQISPPAPIPMCYNCNKAIKGVQKQTGEKVDALTVFKSCKGLCVCCYSEKQKKEKVVEDK